MKDDSFLLFWKGKGYKRKLFSYVEAFIDFLFLRHIRWFKNTIRFHNISLKTVPSGHWLCLNILHPDLLSDNNHFSNFNPLIEKTFLILGHNLQFGKNKILWHIDPSSQKKWPLHYFKRLFPVANTHNSSDCKIPWELSRFQHLPSIVKAYISTGDIRYAKEALFQIDDWIKENPFPYGINWTCAMEVAIRACNWMWAWCTFKDDPVWTEEFNRKFLKSMWQHGWFIEHNLEDKGGIRTNHYLSDIVGLLFIGIMFAEFRDSARWRDFGVKEIVRCMDEMVYEDGESFENSTAYHRLVLELFTYSAILCKKNNIDLPLSFWNRLEKMYEFILYSIRPDGLMPMIGDSDDGRFFILSDYYDWDRWDFRYLLSIGAVFFKRADFKSMAGGTHEEIDWLFGKDEIESYEQL